MVMLNEQDNWLAVDSCASLGSVALMCGGEVLGEYVDDAPAQQVEKLVPQAQHLLQEHGVLWPQLNMIAVTIGPGSFTGVRIGLSMAKALNLAHGTPITPVCSLDVVMHAVEGAQCAVMDARRGQLYVQERGGVPAMVERTAWLAQANGKALAFYGDAAADIKARPARLSAALCADYVWHGQAALQSYGHAEVEPLYIRPPDAKKSVPFLEKLRSLAT